MGRSERAKSVVKMRARIISLEGNRLYVQDHSIKPSYKFDVTDVYYFCKEMFTTDWQKAHEALSSESIDNQEVAKSNPDKGGE